MSSYNNADTESEGEGVELSLLSTKNNPTSKSKKAFVHESTADGGGAGRKNSLMYSHKPVVSDAYLKVIGTNLPALLSRLPLPFPLLPALDPLSFLHSITLSFPALYSALH
jgi:hypothetical protein